MKLRERYRRLNLWNRLAVWGSVASIIGLVLAIVVWVRPSSPSQFEDSDGSSIELTFSPRSAVLGKVQATLTPDGFYEPVQMDVGVKNGGDARATGVAVMLTFWRGTNVRSLDGRWRRDPQTGDYAVFFFEDPQIPLYAKSGRPFGAFQLSLPRAGEAEVLLAVFQLHGDFGRKEGLLFYSPDLDEYRWWHTDVANEAFRRWNREISKWDRIHGNGDP